MILRILFFISYAVLVPANTGPVIPAQTYPFYQQNGYTIPANQPNDIKPYLQGVSAQNPMASMNLSPSNIRQQLFEVQQKKLKGSGYEDDIRYSENILKYFDPIINSHDPNDGYIDDCYPIIIHSAAYNADNINENNIEFKEKNVEETQFRNPPLLELPDFETRRVDKSEINPESFYNFDRNHRFVGNKSPSFSEGITPYYASTKHEGIKSPKDVETVFASSKVVKYGAANSVEEDNSSPGNSNHALTDETYFKDQNGTTYVMAISVDVYYPVLFW